MPPSSRRPTRSSSHAPMGAPEVVQVTGGEQVLVPWPAAPLTSRESVRVRVRVRGAGMRSDWSDPATVEAGLLRTEDWTARFISPRELGGLGAPAPVLRSALGVPDGVVQGTAVRHRARPVRGQAERASCRRPGAGAGVDELRAPAAVPDLRRHRPGPRGRQRARGAAGQRLVSGAARLSRPSWPVRGPVGVAGPARGDDRRRRRPRPGHRQPRGPPARAVSWPTTSTTASGPTSVPEPATAAAPSRWSTPTWLAWSRPTARRCGSPRPCPRPPCSPRRPAPPWSTSGRTSSVGCGSGSGTRPRARRS